MAGELLRFPLGVTDQSRVDLATVAARHDPFEPDRLRILFSLADPAGLPPAVMPPFAGTVWFVADPTDPGAIPTVDGTGALQPPDPAGWRRRGTLMISADKATAAGFFAHGAELAVIPGLAWIGLVELPVAFFAALADPTVITRATFVAGGQTVRPTDASWAAQATTAFLAGSFGLPFTRDLSDPDGDTIARLVASGAAPLAVANEAGRYQIDIRMAVHAGPLDPAAPVGAPPFGADDGRNDGLTDPTAAQNDPAHPSNGAVPARYIYQLLRSDMIDGGRGYPLADAVIDEQTMWLPVRVSMYAVDSGAVFGRLPSLSYDVQEPAGPDEPPSVFDVVTRPLPHHGTLVLHNAQAPGIGAARTLHLDGPIDPVATTVGCSQVGTGLPLTFDLIVFDQPPDTEQPRIALSPPGATMEEVAAAAAPDVVSLLSSPRIKTGLADRYARVEAAIGPHPYPATWKTEFQPTTFHGARAPWSGITSSLMNDLLLGVADVEITALHPPVRPADVFLTWIMEGLAPMIMEGRLRRSFTLTMALDSWTDINAVKTVARVELFYIYCGVDSFNARDPGNDNLPVLEVDQAVTRQAHDAAFDRYRAAVVARGISCPTRQEVHATFSVAKNAEGAWTATPGTGYARALAQMVAAALYEHQMSFIANLASYGVDIAPDADLPAAFRYMCFNANPGDPAQPGQDWHTVVTTDLASPLRFYIDGLRDMTDQPGVWPTLNDWLAKDPIALSEQSRTSGGARTNAIQYWILDEEVGIVFPPELPG